MSSIHHHHKLSFILTLNKYLDFSFLSRKTGKTKLFFFFHLAFAACLHFIVCFSGKNKAFHLAHGMKYVNGFFLIITKKKHIYMSDVYMHRKEQHDNRQQESDSVCNLSSEEKRFIWPTFTPIKMLRI